MKRLLLILLGWLALSFVAQAASFDCSKAQSKIEKMICADAELSRLDEEIAKVYGDVLKKSPDEALLKKQQRGWLKARNLDCKDVPCLRELYQKRIAVLNHANTFKAEESYTLVMSKDDELCNHMMELFNQDLKQYGWRGDEHQENHEEFKRVPWQPARLSYEYYGKVLYETVEGALFDFNNDGVQDFVVRDISSVGNARADLLNVLDREAVKRANDLTVKEFRESGNQIALYGWTYKLSSPLVGEVEAFRVLEPFIYRGVPYLVMRPLFEVPPISTGYAVIAKYGGGKFVNRDMSGKMEDICYYQRNRAKRTH